MAPQQILGIVLRRFPLLVLGVVLPSVVVFLLTSIQPQVYQVSATLLPAQLRLAGDPSYDTVSMSRLVGLATNYAYSAKSNDLLSSVRQDLRLTDSVEDLSKRVDAVVDTGTAVLTITARAGSAAASAALANAVAQAIEDQSAGAQNDPSTLAALQTIRTRMLETEAEYQRLLALPPPRTAENTLALGNALTLLRELTSVNDSLTASVNKTPSGLIVVDSADAQLAVMIAPRTAYYTLLAAIAGLLIAAGIASLLEYLDDTVKSPEDVEEVAELVTMGIIAPTKGERGRGGINQLATVLFPGSSVAEAYRTLRTNVEFASVDAPIQTLLVTSSIPGEGKTVTAANLAVVFAQAGRRVLLVDADLRKPGVHLVFDLPNTHGLTSLLRNEHMDLGVIEQATDQPNLRVLTTGPLPPNPAELVGSQRMRTLVERLRSSEDLVIFDSPPLQAISDSAILSSFMDGTLFVIAAGRSRRGAVHLGREMLARAHAKVLGAVLNSAAHGTHRDDQDDSKVPREAPVVTTRAVGRANPT